MEALVIGGSGFLGGYLTKFFNCKGTSNSDKPGFVNLDICNYDSVDKVLKKTLPEVVINAAAMTNVDECEVKKDLAFRINGDAVGTIAKISKEINAKFVQISTDYVFDGSKGNYTETDKTNPINVYGKSKEIGEENALKYSGVVIRITAPFGINYSQNKSTFFDLIINKLKNNETVNAVTDQYNAPTFIKDVGPAIKTIIDRNLDGIFHLAVNERLSRYDFATKVAKTYGLNIDNILPIRMTSLPSFKANRPIDTSMSINKIKSIFKLKSVVECLIEIRDEVKAFYNLELKTSL